MGNNHFALPNSGAEKKRRMGILLGPESPCPCNHNIRILLAMSLLGSPNAKLFCPSQCDSPICAHNKDATQDYYTPIGPFIQMTAPLTMNLFFCRFVSLDFIRPRRVGSGLNRALFIATWPVAGIQHTAQALKLLNPG